MSMKRPNRKHSVKYLAFLIRLWRESGTAPWRATLQDPRTQDRKHFASLTQLQAFLEEQTGEPWAPDDDV